MKTYLFDTNIWSRWFREEPEVTEKIDQMDRDSKIILSSIVWGEAVYGAKANEIGVHGGRANELFDFKSYSEFIHHKSEPTILQIDRHVSDVYGVLRASLFEKYIRKGKNKRPEQLIDPLTATEIGIDENDLWIVAQAITHNLTLVTNDKMQRIFAVTSRELKREAWK